jgi:hypothetical protein
VVATAAELDLVVTMAMEATSPPARTAMAKAIPATLQKRRRRL